MFRHVHTLRAPARPDEYLAGIPLKNQIVVPLFILGNLLAEIYSNTLQKAIDPLIIEIPENDLTYHVSAVTEFLEIQFSGQWIGRKGPIAWHARSLGINQWNFFALEILKK